MIHELAAATALDGMAVGSRVAVGKVDSDGTASVYLFEKVLRGGELLWKNLTVPGFAAGTTIATTYDDMVVCGLPESSDSGSAS